MHDLIYKSWMWVWMLAAVNRHLIAWAVFAVRVFIYLCSDQYKYFGKLLGIEQV